MLVAVLMICGLACGRKQEAETSTEAVTTEAAAEPETEAPAPMAPVLEAVDLTMAERAFAMKTVSEIHVEGNIASGDYQIDSDVSVLQGDDPEDLQMTAVSSSDMDDIVTKVWYKDGIYHTDNGEEATEEEKNPEEVLELVENITIMVKEAAGVIDEVETRTLDDGSTQYSYEVPDYIVEDYMEEASAQLDIEEMKSADLEVDTASFTTVVGKDGTVTSQKLEMEGKAHVAILAIPIRLEVTAEFSPLAVEELEFPE